MNSSSTSNFSPYKLQVLMWRVRS